LVAAGAIESLKREPQSNVETDVDGEAMRIGLEPADRWRTEGASRARRRARSWAARAALGLAAAAGVVGAAAVASAPPSEAPRQAAAAAPAESEVVDSSLAPAFELEGEGAARPRYEARVGRKSGARRDVLSLGAVAGAAPALRLEMWRRPAAGKPGSLFVEVAEQAAAAGAAIERLSASAIAPSAEGPVEWAEATLNAGGERRACVGFRLLGRVDGGLGGFACAAKGAKLDGVAASRLIDCVTLTRAGREAGFGEVVKEATGRRGACRGAVG
jgi:hypothetical protein